MIDGLVTIGICVGLFAGALALAWLLIHAYDRACAWSDARAYRQRRPWRYDRGRGSGGDTMKR